MSATSQNMSADWWHKEADRYRLLHIKAHQRLVVVEAAARAVVEAQQRFLDARAGAPTLHASHFLSHKIELLQETLDGGEAA